MVSGVVYPKLWRVFKKRGLKSGTLLVHQDTSGHRLMTPLESVTSTTNIVLYCLQVDGYHAPIASLVPVHDA